MASFTGVILTCAVARTWPVRMVRVTGSAAAKSSPAVAPTPSSESVTVVSVPVALPSSSAVTVIVCAPPFSRTLSAETPSRIFVEGVSSSVAVTDTVAALTLLSP